MSPKASKPKGRKTKKRSDQYEEPFQTFSSHDVIAQEFRALLEELDFVPKVINRRYKK